MLLVMSLLFILGPGLLCGLAGTGASASAVAGAEAGAVAVAGAVAGTIGLGQGQGLKMIKG